MPSTLETMQWQVNLTSRRWQANHMNIVLRAFC